MFSFPSTLYNQKKVERNKELDDNAGSFCLVMQMEGKGGNHPNQAMAIEGCQGCGNSGNLARGRAFVMGAEEARQDPNIMTDGRQRPKEKSNNVDVEYMYKKPEKNCSNDATQNTDGNKKEISPNKNMWMIDKGSLENLKMSADKFVVLQDNDTKKGNESDDEEDVIKMNDMATRNLVADEINGLDDHVLNA
uniref:Uncharacterized protein n=1 Tax=Tanacetum cinerariifolium TaxID=118510 RepID=A0A6L2NN66_TANCI|nr:hypothetical protein [Tanacetum cinerariifolium]